MGCVNRSSSEFKSLAARNNVDSNALELIVHKYWLETGNETLFPTDVYIQAQLGNSVYQESGKYVRKLWEKRYSSPQEFSSMDSLQDAYNEASKYFPESAIVYYKNAKGNLVLSVRRPVEKADYSKDDFFDDYDNVGSMRNVKVLNLGIKDTESYGIDKVQELYNRFNTDRTSQVLANKVFAIAKDLGISVSFNESLPFGTMGRNSNANTIVYKKSFLERDIMNDKKASILLHEVLHSLSMYALSGQTKNWKRPEALQQFRTEVNSLYQDLKNNPALKGERGIVDVYEFVAELANPAFRSKIQQIDKEYKDEKKNKESFWSRVLNAFKTLLGLHSSNSYYQRAMNALDKALGAFDVDTYMRYNGIKSQLRKEIANNSVKTQYNQGSGVTDNTTKSGSFATKKSVTPMTTPIKPQYKGKLIYAQSGTGKSTVADNTTVFDSDYILGDVLGVSPETAGFFFGVLSAQQKKAFGAQYRKAVMDKVAQGFTVLTANESLLPDADVVIYNSSAEQTDERVNSANRAFNNRYHAISYHQGTLSKIKKLKENEQNKEYIKLDKDHYLGDYILSPMATVSDVHYDKGKETGANTNFYGTRRGGGLGRDTLDKNILIADFLNEFGISVHLFDDYDGELPLFNALNRVINARSASDITNGVGYAIAFMMQGDPEMQRMIVSSHLGLKGDLDRKLWIPFAGKRSLKNLHLAQHSPIAQEVYREIGKQIASELRSNFGTPIEKVKSNSKVWTIIKNFFKKIGMSIAAFGKRGEVKKQEKLFVRDIIEALGREDFSRIKGPQIKQGTLEKAQRVDIEKALKEHPFEDGIIRKLGEHGIALAGSASIALEGSLLRPSENPLHDIDFNAGNNSSKESLDKLLPTLFPKDTLAFASMIDKGGDDTVTYVTLNVPFETRERSKSGFTAKYYSKDGKYLGRKEGSELYLEEGVQGKLLDFFVGPTKESDYGFHKQTLNGHSYLISNSNAAMAAKILWARPKDMWDYKNFKRNDFSEMSRDFISSLSQKDFNDEVALIKQESADYNIVNGIEEQPKNSGKAVPQDFTFADGTVVKAPFKPNSQQENALNAIDNFIKSDDTSMTLSGYAGTGKTSLMEMIALKCQQEHKPVMFCATTNKAAAVLKARVSKAGFDATTLNKVFGISVEVDTNAKAYNARRMVNVLKDADIMPGTTVIIDEASMINEENYKVLNNIAKENYLKIIYVGDEAQLAPVNETEVSKVFRNGDGKVIRLTQVERTDDNAILKEATDIRNGKLLSKESSFNDKGEGVAYISPQHQDAVNEVIKHYVKGLRQNPDYFRILAYTNNAVAKYNSQVRELLGYTSPVPQKNEPMVGYSNWGYNWRTKTYKLVNSESYKVKGTKAPVNVSCTLSNGTSVTMQAVPVLLENSLGSIEEINFMDIKDNPQNRQAATLLAEEKKRLWGRAKQVYGRQAKAEIYSKINDIDRFLCVNDNIIDANGNYLQTKTIDFGYALTIHKSQGSTFTNVLIDDVDVSRASMAGNNAADAFEMVDLGEENYNDAANAELKSSEDVDLGDLTDVTEESDNSANASSAANLRQQLEYVAVSRATDTVTIISNNIKKEGSPLHPEKTVKNDTVNAKETFPISNTNNKDNGTEEYKATDEFRRVQEGSQKFLEKGISDFNAGRRSLNDQDRERIGGILGRLLESNLNGSWHGVQSNLTHVNKDGSTGNFNVGKVDGKLFHDVFEVTRTYLYNGELVDLHDNYSDCNCYMTSDGLCGFAIEPDGNLVSVYSLSPRTNKGFLYAIKDFIKQEGATHLDAYESRKQPLQEMYSKTLGFHTAATMDYNMEYDHDDIAKNHGNPQVVFMVDHEMASPKHFDKDSYDEAKNYQMEQIEKSNIVNPTFEEPQSYTVSLPGYKHYKDLYEDSAVDAEWKIPYLQELDAQITDDKAKEELDDIIGQMDAVFQATSKDDYLKESKNAGKKKVEKSISEYDKLIRQFNNLLDSNEISASEIRHTAELIVNSISDEITKLQQQEGYAEEIFPSLNTSLDFLSASRRQIVETVGVDNLLNRAKTLFSPEVARYDDIDYIDQAELITDNWDAMMSLASDIFAFNEGFGIAKNFSDGRFTTSDSSSNADYDNFNDYSNDVDINAEEGEKDEQEHWQVESRTIDVLNSMSALVRQGLHECYVLDEDGNKVLSKWGIAERVNPRNAVNSILRWTQGALSLDDMISMLSNKQKQNPWLSQLITRLSDKSGNETDFQSQFYGVFSKHFQLYSIVLLEDGKYYCKYVNSHPALSEAMNTITSLFKIGEHPLFSGDRINSKLLGSDTTTKKDDDFNLHKDLIELQIVDKYLKEGTALNDTMAKTVSNNIVAVCRTFGYNITEDILSDVINAENISKFAEYLGYIVKSLDKALAAQNNGTLKKYDPFAFQAEHNIGGSLRNFLTPITDKLEDTAVNAFYDSGKMYQSYVIPSFTTKLMNKFHLEGKAFEDFLMKEYGSSEWFKFRNHGNPIEEGWRNEWLGLLATDAEARKTLEHKVELNFNKHNYMRNMNDAEYTLSLIAEYFSLSTDNAANMAPAWYRMPMQSNKPSSEFIKFYSYRGSNYKDSIIHGLHGMFLQELSRIQTVRMRNFSKNDSEFIANFDTNGRKFCFLPVLNSYLDNSAENMAKRKQFHNVVLYDEDRLNELQQKKMAWQEASNASSGKNDYYDAESGVLHTEKGNYSEEDIRNMQLSPEEQKELDALERQKKANAEALTAEEDNRFASLLQKKVKGEVALSPDEEVELGKLADRVICKFMENRVQAILDNWDKNGILEAVKNIKDIYPSKLNDADAEAWVRKQVENFLWNDSFASKNILQLTITDIAFYKNTEDLQKRLAQLHAPGTRGNVNAVDYKGNRVSDGKYRTFILNDFDSFKSNIIANIAEVFNRKIREAKEAGKDTASLEALKESLVGKDGKYTKINVTDAQGYSSPSSYRKKALIFGRWSRQAEDIYQKLIKNEYTYTDLETAFQPLKPFVYSKLTKNLGVPNAPIKSMQVPFQAKNAEYLLIMADAILQGEQLSRPNLLRAVYRVMEDSEKINPTMGIDTVQFESAIKSGLQGTLDIHQFIDMPDGEQAAYDYMMNSIYKNEVDASGKRIHKNYNSDVFVHETSYEDYCMQQEVPEHFKEHSQAHGSQIRMITPSDLDLYTTDEDGRQIDNYYEWTEPDGTVKRLKADEFRKEYEQTIAENIAESINNLTAELHLDSKDKKERNIALSRILQREVLSSPRYGVDLIQACSIDKETGEFRIPKGDPIQAKRIEQLINSIIKNRVNKQKIAGGPIVQVSNFGASRQLHIRFNDKQGNLMPLEEEYDASKHDGLSYKDYCKKHQGGIAYFEVFAPMWSEDIFNKFSNTDGSINVEAIEATDPELLKMVSYRIPTEDKYSCAPMKVVGFMPREAGDAIMLPYELTEIDDSDFDVDKRYVMRKDIPVRTKKRRDIENALFNIASESYKRAHGGKAANKKIGEQVKMFMDNPQKMRNTDKFMQWLWKQYQYNAYYTVAPTSGKTYRDNKIVDMTYAVLTNPMTADKILNPGGFDAPKKMGYMVAAYKNPANKGVKWEELERMSTDELKKLSYTDKDLTFADTQVQFYKQNAAAASLIGVFTVNKVAHATLESNGIYIDVSEVCGSPFTIADTTFDGKMQIDAKYDSEGNLIGKTLGSLVSASADAVKDPILNLMNINMTTAGMLNTMLRMGMTFNDAALFLSQNIIERVLNHFNRENLNNYASLSNIIGKWLDAYCRKHDITDASLINSQALTKEELVEGLSSEEHEEIDYKVLLAFQKMQSLVDVMRKPTFATRFNSISSAVGPLIIDNLIMEHKRDAFKDENSENGTHLYSKDEDYGWIPVDIDDIFADHPVLSQFSRTVDIAKSIFLDMPTGSIGFRSLLDKLPDDISDKMYGDKKLLDQFSNFYQSYLLIQSGVVNPSHLKNYVLSFPKWFVDSRIKEKYPDNALVQAIHMNVSKKSGRPFLQINLTGMDEQKKEILRSAWIDLHKADPQLSQMLFNYSFFRAGIGFSPKTFMALVPTYVKERLKSKDGSTSYVGTYRNFPEVIPSLVIDQFIRNNWNNNKLVPWKGGKDTKYSTDVEHNRLTVYREEDKKDVKNLAYMKTSHNKTTYLWHSLGEDANGDIIFERVKPLGNNGEYLEIGLSDILNPLSDTFKTEEDSSSSDMKTTSSQETDAEISSNAQVIPASEEVKDTAELASLITKQVPNLDKEEAVQKIENIKGRENIFAAFLQNVFKQKGLDLNKEEAIKEFKKYC